jgi:predicted Zn-dependent protease
MSLLAGTACGHGAAPERLAALEKALVLRPDDATLLVEQADLLVEHGNHAVARRALDRAEALQAGLPVDRVRARLLLDEGRINEAIVQLGKALVVFPGDALALTLRARAQEAAGDRQASLADYRAAWEASPTITGDFAVEAADALAGGGFPDEAVRLLKQSLVEAGRAPSLMVRLIELEVREGRPAEAVVWAEAMRERAPRPEPWMARRAELLELAGRKPEAHAAWQELAVHLAKLPSLERGSPALRPLQARAARGLDETSTATPGR